MSNLKGKIYKKNHLINLVSLDHSFGNFWLNETWKTRVREEISFGLLTHLELLGIFTHWGYIQILMEITLKNSLVQWDIFQTNVIFCINIQV